jgi:branched-chain amino acid transport system ATP-binding protein
MSDIDTSNGRAQPFDKLRANGIKPVRAEPVEAQHRANPSTAFSPELDEGPGRTNVLLSAKNLSVRFGGVLAVNNVSFDVRPGEVFTLIGPNGAGKTTVFNLISRIYTPTTGSIEYEGRMLTEQPPHRIASLGIARTFQNIELFEHATVLHNMLIGRHTHRKTGLWREMFFTGKVRQAEIDAREKVEKVIDFLDLQHYRDSMVAGLPYGVRKVVELARALCTEPKLLLLDEPSSGLNVEETEDMAFWIQDIKNDLGITVLMVEHDMTLVSKVSDRVLAMNQGEVLAMGTPREVQNHPGVIEAYLGSVDDTSSLRRAA